MLHNLKKILLLSLALAPFMPAQADEPFIGEINYVGLNFAPVNWAMCDGQLLEISQNTALFALLGTNFGGDGRSTLGVPDLRGRVPIHQGRAPGVSQYSIGQMAGKERTSLHTVPTHGHVASAVSQSISTSTSVLHASSTDGDAINPSNASLAVVTATKGIVHRYLAQAPEVDMVSASVTTSTSTDSTTTVAVTDAGAGNEFLLLQPYTVVTCVIALEGVFPSRS